MRTQKHTSAAAAAQAAHETQPQVLRLLIRGYARSRVPARVERLTSHPSLHRWLMTRKFDCCTLVFSAQGRAENTASAHSNLTDGTQKPTHTDNPAQDDQAQHLQRTSYAFAVSHVCSAFERPVYLAVVSMNEHTSNTSRFSS